MGNLPTFKSGTPQRYTKRLEKTIKLPLNLNIKSSRETNMWLCERGSEGWVTATEEE